MDKRGEYQDFPSNIFFLTVPKISVGEPFCFTKFLVSKKLMDKRGGMERREGVSRFSVQKFFSHSYDKFRRGTLLCCVSENIR